MSIVKKTLQQIIEFSEKQKAAQIRRLKADGKSEKTVQVDAYSNVIGTLSSILEKEKENPHNNSEDSDLSSK